MQPSNKYLPRALVTGATGDIGEAICLKLADHYHIIVHTAHQPQKANILVEQIITRGGSAEYFQCDLSDANATATAIQTLLAEAPIQILVNNAGIHEDIPFAGMEYSQWQKVIDLNLNTFYHVTQPLLLPMMATRWGRIISLSSIAALAGNRGQVNYAAAKAALHGASKSLALEVASRGITVNVVAPGIIATTMTAEKFPAEMIKRTIPMQRAGTSKEIAAVVNFLASEDASYLSGQIISVNGAML